EYTYDYKTICAEFDDGVCLLTLDRPDKRNAMNPVLGEEITDALEKLRNDKRCRVLVITGAGESFCAGMDLKEFFIDLQDKPAEYDRAHRVAVEWRGRTLRLFPKPTIAMVNGHCFGGAFTIVEGCDLAVAAEDAKMGLSEINFKMFPGGSVGKSMGNLLRPRDYMLYALTGRPMTGKIAAEIGLINYAVPRQYLRDDVMALAHEIAAKDASALQATREIYTNSIDMNWDTAMNYALALQSAHTARQANAFREEGIGDFLEKKYKPGLGGHEDAER
ncbi:MAG: p-hydroxycinnamoyl CoA hydratase/lyase, partial [Pseudomonadota bacterium]|nr:p-hydroxycinnamoyl CoA hydratase/lyase [Pseudomonadota bacterium]